MKINSDASFKHNDTDIKYCDMVLKLSDEELYEIAFSTRLDSKPHELAMHILNARKQERANKTANRALAVSIIALVASVVYSIVTFISSVRS